jgi:FMN phosphatase YigB (HAD superfamily)
MDDLDVSGVRHPQGRPGRIRAVLFDVDGTLYHQRRLQVLMAIELCGLPIQGLWKARRRLEALRAYRRAQEQLRTGGGHAGVPTDQLAIAAEKSGLPRSEVDSLVREWMQVRPLKYLRLCRFSGVMAFLDFLAKARVHTGVLSDYPSSAKLDALGVSGRFTPVLCASDPDIQAFKPSPRGFLRACEVWGLEPSQVLMIGDRPEVDAVGAAAAGMPCVIVGSADTPVGDYLPVSSFERLQRVLDGR